MYKIKSKCLIKISVLFIHFLEFIRLKVCLFLTGLGISGYILFNHLDQNILSVGLTCFLVGASGYSYNMITDKEEDKINKKKINPFAKNKKSYLLVVLFILLGAIACLPLSEKAIAFYWIMIALNISYSLFRMKKIFPLKNLFAGLGLTLIFFIGATNTEITSEMLMYYSILTIFIFTASLISDLRDYKGDKLTNIKTLPVTLGYKTCRHISSALIYLASLTVIAVHATGLYLLAAFSIPIAYRLHKDNPVTAHQYILLGFIMLPFGALL